MNNDYIRKQDAVDALKAQADTMRTWVERYAEQRRGILTAVNIVEDIKPADVVPVVHGEWLEGYKTQPCSRCKFKGKKSWTFCPHCGARMIYGERKKDKS